MYHGVFIRAENVSRCTTVGAGGMLSGHRFPPHISLHLTASDCAAFGKFMCRVAEEGHSSKVV